jgi:hypothetical protein
VNDPKKQYKFEYDQRLPGYSGDLPEHWSHRVEVQDSSAAIKSKINNLNAYIEHQAENYPGEWVRNVTTVMERTITYSEWEESNA